jgi:RNA polymerase sigma-B factor
VKFVPSPNKKSKIKQKKINSSINKIVEKKNIKQLLKIYQKTRNPQIREKLILMNLNLVANLAKRFANRGEPLKDLIQVGNLGLIQAIDRFDVKKGVEFVTFATPTILGEIKRYFRDKGWMVKVPRRLQELNLAASKAIDKLTQNLGRSPTLKEIARFLKASEEEIIAALELSQAYSPLSLDAGLVVNTTEVPSTLLDLAGEVDKEIEGLSDKDILKEAFKILNKQERIIIYWRFYENLTQVEIARKLKVSQMQISRLQQKALRKMRQFMKATTDVKFKVI